MRPYTLTVNFSREVLEQIRLAGQQMSICLYPSQEKNSGCKYVCTEGLFQKNNLCWPNRYQLYAGSISNPVQLLSWTEEEALPGCWYSYDGTMFASAQPYAELGPDCFGVINQNAPKRAFTFGLMQDFETNGTTLEQFPITGEQVLYKQTGIFRVPELLDIWLETAGVNRVEGTILTLNFGSGCYEYKIHYDLAAGQFIKD